MKNSKTPMAGGFIMAISTFAGAMIGASQRQMSAGTLLGLLAGAVIATLIWAVDRRR